MKGRAVSLTKQAQLPRAVQETTKGSTRSIAKGGSKFRRDCTRHYITHVSYKEW
jgi:hypothetical protein